MSVPGKIQASAYIITLNEEKNLSRESLKYAVLKLLEDANLRGLMRKRLENLAADDAAGRLADEVEALLQDVPNALATAQKTKEFDKDGRGTFSVDLAGGF